MMSLSERFKNGWRNIKTIKNILISIFLFNMIEAITFSFEAICEGAILFVLYNSMSARIFSIGELTLFQAVMILLTLKSLGADYSKVVKWQGKAISEELVRSGKNEKKSRVFSVIIVFLSEAIVIFSATCVITYTWNEILVARLINVDEMHFGLIKTFILGAIINITVNYIKRWKEKMELKREEIFKEYLKIFSKS